MNLGYVIFYVADVAATAAFYEKAFGLTRRFSAESGLYIEMETGATALGFTAESFAGDTLKFARLRAAATPPGIEIAFVTDDVAAAVAKAAEAGAVVVAKPATKPWGQIVAVVADNNGALVELCTKMG